MNSLDKQNLQFILQSDERTLRSWWSEIDHEEKEYAMKLLDIASAQLKEQSLALRIEAELALSDYSESKTVLEKIFKSS